jgi:membrane-bound inhibitor of C-type lysozyme
MTRRMGAALLGGLVIWSLPAHAELVVKSVRYSCDRGVEVPVAYVDADGASVAILQVEGRQIALWQETAASGARYGWPSGGSNYVWWTKGDTASLLWKDGTAQTETVLLQDCVVLP